MWTPAEPETGAAVFEAKKSSVTPLAEGESAEATRFLLHIRLGSPLEDVVLLCRD